MPRDRAELPRGRHTPRQAEILRIARHHGSVAVSDLARSLDVSLETIRRTVRPLVDAGELLKSHGRIAPASPGDEAPFERRLRENAAEKRRIAAHVAASIEDGDSVMIDTGTTTSLLARELLAKRGLTIVTNSSDVARTLATVNGNRVYMAGGELHGDNGAAFGPSAIEFVRRFAVRHAVISIAAINERSGLMDYHLAEAEFARIVLQCGERRLVATDHTKFNRAALVKVCDLSDVDVLVTDRPPASRLARALAASGTRIEIAAGPP